MEQNKLQELLLDMSLKEKVGQLVQVSGFYFEEEGVLTGPENTVGFTQEEIDLAGTVLGSIGAERLRMIQKKFMERHPHHIPLIFMLDIINGYRTVFPIPLAQSCSFDPALAKRCASIAAKEAAAAGAHVTFSPMVDVARDARWGRVMESGGEDPFLNGCFARACVEGYQGKKGADGSADLAAKGKIGSCVKHFAAYGAPEAGREYNTVELSERTLRDTYLPPYREAVDAGASMVMASFNTLNRVPSAANKRLMREILRKEMGFGGVTISDWAAFDELMYHGLAGNRKEAAYLAVEAGMDIDMMTSCYSKNLEQLVREGCVDEALLDEAVMRVLELKNALGLFENPFKDADELEEKEILLCDEHRKAARCAAAETFVLLKNEGILPLKREGQKVAFIGPHVENKSIFGVWSMFGREEDTVSIADALRQRGIQTITAKGCAMFDNGRGLEGESGLDIDQMDEKAQRLLEEAVEAAESADAVVLALGEHRLLSGEAASRAQITIPECQRRLLLAVQEVNPNVVVVLFSGRPLDIRELSERAKAVLNVWQPGTEGGNAILDVLYGDTNPSGKLSMSFPWCVGQVPVCYSELSTGRPYMPGRIYKFQSQYLDIPNRPLYPFGFGMSYTDFYISEAVASDSVMTRKKPITVSVTVKNTGNVKGAEVVQLYIRDCVASVARPVRELKGFQKVWLEPGEEREVSFSVTEEMLRFTGADMEYASENGRFCAYVGNSSETQNEVRFELKN